MSTNTPNVKPPAAVTSVGDWDSTDTTTGRLTRSLQWATFDAGRIAVDIDGLQDETGAVTGPYISVYGFDGGSPLTAEDARQAAAVLVDAADEYDRITNPYPVDSNLTVGDASGMDLGAMFDAIDAGEKDSDQ